MLGSKIFTFGPKSGTAGAVRCDAAAPLLPASIPAATAMATAKTRLVLRDIASPNSSKAPPSRKSVRKFLGKICGLATVGGREPPCQGPRGGAARAAQGHRGARRSLDRDGLPRPERQARRRGAHARGGLRRAARARLPERPPP